MEILLDCQRCYMDYIKPYYRLFWHMEKKPVYKTDYKKQRWSSMADQNGRKNKIQNQTLGNKKLEPLKEKFDKLKTHQYGHC
jgi:hypothetical protein